MPFNTASLAPLPRPLLNVLFWLTILLGADGIASPRCFFGKGERGWDFFVSAPTFSIIPPILHDPEDKNLARALLPPSTRHFLGTDDLGRDVAAVVVHGTRRSVFTALLATTVVLFFAVAFGAVSGFLGDEKLRVSLPTFSLATIGALAGGFFDFWWAKAPVFWALGGATGVAAGWFLSRFFRFSKFSFPFDSTSARVGEMWYAVPAFLALLVSTALLPHRYYTSGLILGLLQWPPVAWSLRAETKKTIAQDYVSAAYASGAGDGRVFWRHVLPNALPAVRPVLLQVAAASVVAEAAIAFLGLGPEYVSWGGLMAAARKYPDAWWLAVFPGAALYFFVRFLYKFRGTAS